MRTLLILFICLLSTTAIAQQRVDASFQPNITDPAFTDGEGPVLCIDSAHNNLHTLSGGYAPFGRIASAEGYRPVDHASDLTRSDALTNCDIFLIVNALNERNIRNWVLPTPSAFSPDEIENLKEWVETGGSLFLIADHMPFAGAASDLAAVFGIQFSNGFATLRKESNQPDLFNFSNGRLHSNALLDKEISSVTSFTGSAFKIPDTAEPLLSFKEGDISLEPRIAWRFEQDTDTVDISGYSQGALMRFGEGKVVVMGEAAMFTAQIIDTDRGAFKIGLNNEELAPQNLLFLRNLLAWLAAE